ncbi:ABC transporter permease [Leptospira wolffii]|uniref:ABC transporter permease n=1 Tax=Leptospira wolffii TaxID=409998 RepID=A0ABV5BR61_9LEPT|nr:efflux ABC transporter permease [Leptospira wolffii]EPG67804.1 efflux ABC transporter, permease protein [Leptospira wolffii serovar Khorat str. Khorat-H2]TGL45336.1 ABC transporter permease [Leptospira wolffii]
MGRITYLRFAFSLFLRDWITSVLHVAFSSFFAYGLIFGVHSLRAEKAPADITNIDLFLKSPYLVLSLSGLALVFMTVVRVMGRSGDNGIMMAVGGNRPGVVLLLTLEVWILHVLGFLSATLLTAFFPYGKSELTSFLDYLGSLTLDVLLVGAIGSLVAFFYTLMDPYQSIRRGK